MSGLDLSAAIVDAGADALMSVLFPNAMPWEGMTAWESTRDDTKEVLREKVRPILAAAAPLIEAQVREQVAAEIEATAAEYEGAIAGHPRLYYDTGMAFAFEWAARTARGAS